MTRKMSSLIIFILLSFAFLLPVNAQTYSFTQFTFGSPVSDLTNSNSFGGPTNTKLIIGPWILDQFTSSHVNFLQKFSDPINSSKIPYMYFYIVAGKARADLGLNDCNVGPSPTLCEQGANYIRSHNASISQAYMDEANNVKANYGTTKPIFIHFEPDYYQYQQAPGQVNPLTNQEAWNYMNNWTSSVKAILPNAILVMDISSWNTQLETWSLGFNNFDLGGLVGKPFPANSTIDGQSYATLSQNSHKKIIVNDSNGQVNGSPAYDTTWDDRNTLNLLWNSGVVAVFQPNLSTSHYQTVIDSYTTNPVPASATTTTPILSSTPLTQKPIVTTTPIVTTVLSQSSVPLTTKPILPTLANTGNQYILLSFVFGIIITICLMLISISKKIN